MARSKVYRHDVRCPHCGSNWMRQNGHAAGRQDCRRPGSALKKRALRMYSGGSSLRAIGRVPGYSAPAVLGGAKKGAPGPEPAAGAEPAAH